MDKNFMKPKLLIGLCTMSCIGLCLRYGGYPHGGHHCREPAKP